tara:strand:+ start:2867 stop:5845 length:2979 start_codon:yes stop_codon:yes gene_type:complete
MMKVTQEMFEQENFIGEILTLSRTEIEDKIDQVVENKLESEGKGNDFDENEAQEELNNKKITQEEFDNQQRAYNEYEDVIENQVRAIYADMRSNFPVMNFLKYAEEEITSNSESDDNLAEPELLRFDSKIDSEIELTDFFIRNDTDKKGRDYLSGREIQKRVKDYLFNKYPKLKKILSNKAVFIRDLISTLRNVAKEDSPTSLALKPQATMEYLDKSKEARLKQTFSYFILNNKRLKIDTFFQLKNPSFSNLRMEGRFNEEKLEDAKDLLTRSYAGKQAEQVKPLLQLIDKKLTGVEFGETEDLKLDIDTDKFVGTLDLKKVSRRNAIYSYWRKTNMDFKEVKISIKNFQEQLNDVVQNFSEEMDRDIKILTNKIINFDVEYQGDKDALNYIVKVGAKSIKRLDKNDRYVKAFANLGKFTKESVREKEGLSERTRMQSSRNIAQQQFRDKKSNETRTNRKAGDYGLRADAAPEGGQSEFDEDLQSDKARQLAAKYSDKGDFAGLMQEITFDDATGRGMTGLIDGLDEFGRESSELVNTDVDPLFGYAFLTDKDVFKNLALFEDELEKLKTKLQTLSNMGKTVNLDVDYDDGINDYLEELQELVISDKKEFYLPISPELNKLVDSVNYEKMSSRVEYIQEFLQLISQIIEFGEKSEQSGAGGSANVGGKKSGASYNVEDLSRQNTKNLFKEIAESKDAFDEMLNNIISYYVVPTETSYRPFNSKIQITNTRLNAILSKAKSAEEPYFHLLSLYIRGVDSLFPSGNFKVLDNITELLKFITTASRFTDREKLENRLENLRKELRNIYDYSFDDIIEEELNAYYYGTLKRTLNKKQLDNLELFGKKSKVIHENVSKNVRIYPLHALIQIVRDNQKAIEDKVEEIDGFDGDVIKDFEKQMKKFSATIVKSDTEIQLLEAHDNIRKMLNKPVYYKYGNIDDFANVSTTIDILKSTFNVDVTALDIENIVKETDSMENLGLKYGISSEGVYFVKANFR